MRISKYYLAGERWIKGLVNSKIGMIFDDNFSLSVAYYYAIIALAFDQASAHINYLKKRTLQNFIRMISKKIPLVSIFFLLFYVHTITAQTNPADSSQTSKYNSLLWEITGNGLTKPSYLYGTMHVSQKIAFHLTDTFFIALNKCNAIALEEDPGMWMEDMMNSGYLSEMRGDYFSNRYGNFYKSAFQIELPKNRDYAQTLSFQPDLVNGLLYRFYSREGNFEENTYLDLFIYQSAKKIGKPVIGLEEFAEGQEFNVKANMPDSDKTDYDGYPGSRRDITEEIESAYRKGDLDLLDSLSRVASHSKNMQKYLIDERNKNFASQMDSIMQSSTSLFTGVGAAHLPGEKGVISLLRSKGYNVRPVVFKQSKKADQDKQKIENTFRPNTYSIQYFPDSSLSLMTPGKLYKLIGGANSFFVYPDMTNGAYYSIFAMNRFEEFTGESMQYSIDRIDSLLYENVPGKILSKKYMKTPEGYSAVDITNRNRRGDVSRYRIIVSPEYIYFFVVSGTGDYVLDKEHDKYFNSIRLPNSSPSKDWKRVYGEDGGYSMEMPGNIYSDVKGGGGEVNTNSAFIHSFNPLDSSFYLFMRTEFPDYDYIEEDTFELAALVDEFADQFDLIVDSKEISPTGNSKSGGHPSLLATLHKDANKYFIRIVINGPHYNLLCCRPGIADNHERFLSSFRLEPMQYSQAFEEVKDTSMHFTVKTFPEKKSSAFALGMRNLSERFSDDDNDYSFSSDKIKNRTFKSPLSNEFIFVSSRKYNLFHQSKGIDKFWKYHLEDVNSDSSMFVVGKKISQKDSMDVMSFTLVDTASTRGIKFKMILRKDVLYTLCATVDTLESPGSWLTTFFDSFTPDDTAAAESIFTPKTKKYFEYLMSSDSAKNKIARRNFWNVRFDSTMVPQMIAWMKDSVSLKSPSSLTENMINRIGTLNNNKSVPFLKELYAKSEDSSNIQMAILGALAARQTLEGTLAFKELILKAAPLSSDNYHITSMFTQFYDTLELAAKLYPSLLQLTRYPEYKEEVYQLLAAITINRKIKADEYKTFIPDILHDANDELKREFHSEENSSDNDDDNYGDGDYAESIRGNNYNYNSRSGRFGFNSDSYNSFGSASRFSTKTDLYEHNSATEDFAILLVKFYSTDNGVKNFFNKLQKAKNNELVLKSYVLMLHDSVSTPDSVWTSYSASKELRSKLYSELKKINRLDKFDTAHSSQLDMAESMLFHNFKFGSDSIVFMEKRFIKAKRDSGYVYVYKYKREKATKWMVGYNYFQPGDTAKVDVTSHIRFEAIKDPAKLPKQIDKIYKKLALTGRQRAGSNYDYGDEY